MNVLSILKGAQADGVTVRLDAEGKLRAFGPPAARAKWTPALRQRKVEILAAFKTASTAFKTANEIDLGGLEKGESEQGGCDRFSFKTANSQSVAALRPDVQDRQTQNLGGLGQKRDLTPGKDGSISRPPTLKTLGGLDGGLAVLNSHPEVASEPIVFDALVLQREADQRNARAVREHSTDRFCSCGSLAESGYPDGRGGTVWRCWRCFPVLGRA